MHLFIMVEKIASLFSKRAIFIVPLSRSPTALHTASVLSSIHSHIHAVVTATTLSGGGGCACPSGEAYIHYRLHSEDTESAAM